MDENARVPTEERDLFRSLVDHSLGLMCVHDLEGNLLFVNTAAAETLGFRPEDGIGGNLRQFLSPAAEDEFDAYLERIRSNGVDSGRMSLMSKEGRERIWQYRNVLHEVPGMPARVLGHAQDVTESVRAVQALKESERRFRLLANTTPVLIWMSDPSGSCTFVNQPWLDFTGRPEAEHLGAGWTNSIHPEDRPRVIEAFGAAVTSRAPFRAEYRLRRVDDAYRWMMGYGVPRIGEDGSFAGLVGSSVDLTDERRAREALEIAQTHRIESLGVLAGGVAHEFNNMLTVIAGRIQLLLDRLSGDEPACHDLYLIQRSAQRAAELTRELLAFGRRQLLQPRLVDLNDFVKELALATRVGSRIEATFHFEEPLRQIHVDPGQLKRAILHLVEHACDAMPAGGRLAVETANVDLDDAFVHAHPGAAAGPHVRVTIHDSGTGLDEATQSRLFEPFFTAKRGVQGSGLSLPAVYGITAQHGGYLAVESEPHSGTTFMMYLPAVAGEGSPAVGTAARGPEGPRGTETILLIEHDKDVRLLLRDVLEPHGYRVIETADLAEALALVTHRAEPIHLILATLGEDGGFTVFDQLRGARPDAKMLCVSDRPAAAAERRGAADPAVLQKPFTVLHLLGKVRQVLDGRDG
jgi:PAS domain S-box-containing protein